MNRASSHRTPYTVGAGHCSPLRFGALAATLLVLVLSPSPSAAQSTLYVDASATGTANGSSWCDAFVHLQNALAVGLASGGLVTEIRIAEGVYRPDRGTGQTLGDRTATFGLIDAVVLRGGYAGCSAPDPDARDIQLYLTALSGDLLGNDDPSEFPGGVSFGDNSYHVLTSGSAGDGTLEGLTITAGHADGGPPHDNGGALYIAFGAPTLRQCSLTGNFASFGGAIHNNGGELEMIDCLLAGNTAASWGGALDNFSASATLVNCLLVGNTATGEGGAIHSDLSTLTVTNSTLIANTAGNRGGGVFNYAGVLATLTNDILWDNFDGSGGGEPAQVFNNPSNAALINHTCLEGWTGAFGGIGNLATDPLFERLPTPGPDGTWNGLNDDYGDLHLDAASASVDAGDNNADTDTQAPGVQPLPAADLDGHARIANGTVDLGAYERQQAVAVATADPTQGKLDSMYIDAPWTVRQDVAPIGPQARVRYFFDRIYSINRSLNEIQVLDPESFDILRSFRTHPAASPEDILVVSPDRAFVTLYDSTELAKVDPATGAPRGSVDLALFADADGLPEMSMMARDGNHLFIQIQRIDRAVSGNPVSPSYLAVLDLQTDMLIDVDPGQPGIQGIELVGTQPSFKMHVDSRARRLFVSTPGPRLDTSGGIEEIDLDSLSSLGFILAEADVGADLGGFVMTSADTGYALAHTDIVASSHLAPFSRAGGQGSELMLTFGFIDTMVLDPVTAQLFFPDPFSNPFGVHVVDTATNTILTRDPVATGLPPWDLAVVRHTAPGEAGNLRVEGVSPLTGELSLAYRPACGAQDHNIVFGPLDAVGTYGYSGQVCGVGTTGAVEAFQPGDGSYFFVIVGTGTAADDGSYGTDGMQVERPEDLDDPVCSFSQDLIYSCDR